MTYGSEPIDEDEDEDTVQRLQAAVWLRNPTVHVMSTMVIRRLWTTHINHRDGLHVDRLPLPETTLTQSCFVHQNLDY